MTPMRICLVKMSSMGDVIHALPVVTDILRARPDAHVHWIVEESFADLPVLHPGVAGLSIVALRRWRRQWRDPAVRGQLGAARRALQAWSFDRIIDLQGLLKSAWVGRWSWRQAGGLHLALRARTAGQPDLSRAARGRHVRARDRAAA
ncbi:MAG: hypothetical protein R3E68_20375 [Burkholderiaceae bacterium]